MSLLIARITVATAWISVIFSVGLVGDSSQTTFVFGLMAAAIVWNIKIIEKILFQISLIILISEDSSDENEGFKIQDKSG
jgi:hypothetical protein